MKSWQTNFIENNSLHDKYSNIVLYKSSYNNVLSIGEVFKVNSSLLLLIKLALISFDNDIMNKMKEYG